VRHTFASITGKNVRKKIFSILVFPSLTSKKIVVSAKILQFGQIENLFRLSFRQEMNNLSIIMVYSLLVIVKKTSW